MSARLLDGISMRLLCAFVLAPSLWVLPIVPGGERATALAQPIGPPSESAQKLLLEAGYICGTFDGKFGCKFVPGSMDHGKNAIPGVENKLPDVPPEGAPGQEAVQPGEHSCPPGYKVLAVPNASGGYCEPAEATNMGCQRGMIGTPPNCHCPKNSELLGGNCVHYTATCSNGLAANALPQACAAVDEKLACKMREDGLKDCCCLLYDKM
jgi:hypothetical protein